MSCSQKYCKQYNYMYQLRPVYNGGHSHHYWTWLSYIHWKKQYEDIKATTWKCSKRGIPREKRLNCAVFGKKKWKWQFFLLKYKLTPVMLWKASTSLLENFTRCSINPEWDSDIVVVWWFVLSLHPNKCWDFDMTLNFHECLTIETLRGHRSWFVLESDVSEANADFHWMSEDWYQLYNVSTLKFAKLLTNTQYCVGKL